MPPAPEDDAFLTARSIHATDMENTWTVLTGDCVSYAHREVTDYYEKNPYVILITNRAQLLKYWEVYPDMKADKYYQDRYLSDGWFDDHALLLATNTEYYVNVYCNSWYAFTKPGGILCVGYYDTRSDYDYSFDRKYEIPNSVTFGIEVERNLSNISSIQIMHLSLKETQSLSRVDYQPYTLPVTD